MAYKRYRKGKGKRKFYKRKKGRKKQYEPYNRDPATCRSLVCRSVKSPLPSAYYCTFTVQEDGYWSTTAGSMPNVVTGIPLYPYRPYLTSVGSFTNFRAMTNYVSKGGTNPSGTGWTQLIANSANTIGIYNYFCPISAELELEVVPQGSGDNMNIVVVPQPRISSAGSNVATLSQYPMAQQYSVNWIERQIIRYRLDIAKFLGITKKAMLAQGIEAGYAGTYNAMPTKVSILQVGFDTSDSATAFTAQVTVRSRLRIFGKCFVLDPSSMAIN